MKALILHTHPGLNNNIYFLEVNFLFAANNQVRANAPSSQTFGTTAKAAS